MYTAHTELVKAVEGLTALELVLRFLVLKL